jgi:hypothetical protein
MKCNHEEVNIVMSKGITVKVECDDCKLNIPLEDYKKRKFNVINLISNNN